MTGGKSIFDDYVREVRPRFLVRRTFQRTVYRPGELVQCDLWEPREPIPVGHGQTRRGWVVTVGAVLVAGDRRHAGLLARRRRTSCGAWAAALSGSGRCRRSWCGTARARSRRRGRPTDEFAGVLRPARRRLGDPRRAATRRRRVRSSARTGSCARTSSPAGGSRTRPTSSCSSTAGATRSTGACTARPARSRPSGWSQERERMRPLPERLPDLDRRFVIAGARSSPICGSTATTTRSTPRFAGRRVEVRVSQTRDHGGRARHGRARVPAPARVRRRA